jgi:serine/threonine protein kinase
MFYPNPMNELDIVAGALRHDRHAERAVYLTVSCGSDVELRQRVERLLQLHDSSVSRLQGPAAESGHTVAEPPGGTPDDGDFVLAESSDGDSQPPPDEAVGTCVGPYKLLQLIGQGGMGAVYVAEQERPVKRRVALKVIKPGMDSERIIRRFEAERQALALMDHTHIAKVLDAGTTEQGRPYFVMELVRGESITKYCDVTHLSVRDRLTLFIQVCRAVQHAHHKGVIHRDIKPSNVLVCMQDGRPMSKVIDFGLAKALHQKLAEQSMYTEVGAVLGTLEYMSPEQAELSAMDVDTRTDVYALGVLLYELLAGTTPLDRERLRNTSFVEMLRLIRAEEPPRPSTRLSQSKQALAGLGDEIGR